MSVLGSKLAEHATVMCGEINNEMAGEKVIIAGMVSSVRNVTTKNNRIFAVVNFEDLNGSIEVTVWSDVYSQTQDLWLEGNILLVEGTVKIREDRANINCNKVRKYEATSEKEPKANNGNHISPKKLTINIKQSDNSEKDLAQLQQIFGVLRKHPGNDHFQLAIHKGETVTRLDIPDLAIDYSVNLMNELKPILGM